MSHGKDYASKALWLTLEPTIQPLLRSYLPAGSGAVFNQAATACRCLFATQRPKHLAKKHALERTTGSGGTAPLQKHHLDLICDPGDKAECKQFDQKGRASGAPLIGNPGALRQQVSPACGCACVAVADPACKIVYEALQHFTRPDPRVRAGVLFYYPHLRNSVAHEL